MPLILAIEPDRRQASKINALARGPLAPLHVELVITDSAEKGIAALGERVPDLILTPQLLLPRDEAALTDRLRDLDDAGAHVQTLVIPQLGSTRQERDGGILRRLRRSKQDTAPAACDPAVFAQQIAEYLERAETERSVRAVLLREQAAAAPAARPESADEPPEAAPRAAEPSPDFGDAAAFSPEAGAEPAETVAPPFEPPIDRPAADAGPGAASAFPLYVPGSHASLASGRMPELSAVREQALAALEAPVRDALEPSEPMREVLETPVEAASAGLGTPAGLRASGGEHARPALADLRVQAIADAEPPVTGPPALSADEDDALPPAPGRQPPVHNGVLQSEAEAEGDAWEEIAIDPEADGPAGRPAAPQARGGAGEADETSHVITIEQIDLAAFVAELEAMGRKITSGSGDAPAGPAGGRDPSPVPPPVEQLEEERPFFMLAASLSPELDTGATDGADDGPAEVAAPMDASAFDDIDGYLQEFLEPVAVTDFEDVLKTIGEEYETTAEFAADSTSPPHHPSAAEVDLDAKVAEFIAALEGFEEPLQAADGQHAPGGPDPERLTLEAIDASVAPSYAAGAPLDSDVWMPLDETSGPGWPPVEGVEIEDRVVTPLAAAPVVEAAPAVAPAAAPGGSAKPERRKRIVKGKPRQKEKPKKDVPVQDEWGFFDPEQCGFAALLDKLDEITDDKKKTRSR